MDDAAGGSPSPCYREDAVAVVRALRGAGHVAYFAGGCVRDVLLGLEPKDYDVATDAHPQAVRSVFRNTQAVGAKFGVILVRLGRSVIEVATFRSDGRYVDGRRPEEVRFTTAQEDARRRDFTMNGLFLDPVSDEVIDYVGGRADLSARTVRAIGKADERFEEDHLRMLRAVRFAARFGFAIEGGTAGAIEAHAQQLIRISPERIADELRMMLTPNTRAGAFGMLWKFRLLDVVFRYVEARGDGKEAQFAQVAPGRAVPFGLALAAAAVSRYWPGPDSRELFRRGSVQGLSRALRVALRLTNEETAAFEGTISGVDLLLGEALTLAMKKRFLARPTSGSSRDLLRGIAPDSGWEQRQTALELELAELEKTEFAPLPLVTGDDLTEAGLTPGPVFKRVLDAVYDAQLEGSVGTKDEGMRMALELARG